MPQKLSYVRKVKEVTSEVGDWVLYFTLLCGTINCRKADLSNGVKVLPYYLSMQNHAVNQMKLIYINTLHVYRVEDELVV